MGTLLLEINADVSPGIIRSIIYTCIYIYIVCKIYLMCAMEIRDAWVIIVNECCDEIERDKTRNYRACKSSEHYLTLTQVEGINIYCMLFMI